MTNNLQLTDGLHASAVIILVALVSTCAFMYTKVLEDSADLRLLHLQTARPSAREGVRLDIILAFLTIGCLSLVRLSILFLYRTIFWVSSTFRKLWWAVVALLFFVFVPIVGTTTILGTLGYGHNASAEFECAALWLQCALSVSSDVIGMNSLITAPNGS